ncbi:hypothetical protein D3C87_2037940 [compost metagenome]
MIDGNYAVMSRIEQEHGLYGYPPEIVSVGLHAAAEGRDVAAAVDAHLAGDQL